MKIYTGTGDRGKTGLFSGERIDKDDLRVEAYGDVDELNSLIGLVLAVLPPGCEPEADDLRQIQGDLFQAGACLASSPAAGANRTFRDMDAARVVFLENAIDRMDAALPRLGQFVLPGGHPAACQSHVARCVCRRAERHAVRLARETAADAQAPEYPNLLQYLNRLSDQLFVLARYINHLSQHPDVLWEA